MRRAISFLLVLMLILTSGIAAFAADVTIPTDVKGTNYESAVKNLMEKTGISGYSDGTFRPANTINRAEVCTIVVKAMQPSDVDLKAAENKFTDMAVPEYNWASSYVNYGAARKVVSGYSGNLFKPGNEVTYNEMAAMLINALGYTDKDLTGTWPENYMAKAKELGIFKNVAITGNGELAAARGDVALMTDAVVDQIIAKHKPIEPTKPTKPTTTGSAVAPSDNNAAIFEKAGGAFGMINGVSSVTDKDGDQVAQIEFFMNGNTYNLNTNKSGVAPVIQYDGSLYYIKFDANKAVRNIYADPSSGNPKHFVVLAGQNGWANVADRVKTVVTVTNGASTDEVNMVSDVILYRATFDGDSVNGYEKGSLSDITAGAKIRAYDVTDDKSAMADIAVYITSDDVAKHKL